MGIKYDTITNTWTACYSKRHDITRMSVGLRRKGFKSKKEAERAFADLIVEVHDKIRKTIVPVWPELVEQYKHHLELAGMISPRTIESMYTTLKAHTFQMWSKKHLDEVTGDNIRELLTTGVLAERSDGHRKNVVKYVRGALTYAVELGLIQSNPTPQIKFKGGEKITKVLTAEQVKTFLNKAKEYDVDWYPIWCMAVYTGMRTGELYALTWDKVDLDRRTMKVDTSWRHRVGFKSTKSGDDRVVEIAPTLLPLLKELKLKRDETNFVLPRLAKWDHGDQARELRMFLIGLGLPPVTFHTLRAVWATLMLNRGIEPIKVMSMGGWKDLKTMQRYIRMAAIDIKGITDGLNLHNFEKNLGKVLKI